MEDYIRRLEKLEDAHPAHMTICGETFRAINQRLEHGSVKFAEHEKEINFLKLCQDSVKNDVNKVSDDIGEIKSGWNKVLSGIAVACILLTINALIMWFGG